MRTRARPFNKGLRLDYFVCSQEMFDRSNDNVKIEVEKIDDEIKAELVVEMGEGKIEEEEAVVVAKGKSGRKRKMETTTTTPAAAPLVAEENIIVTVSHFDVPRILIRSL